jgi:hypothetical protein
MDNPNGVFFGPGAKINVNGLIATTADLDNRAFMKGGKLVFNEPGDPDAAIVNEGNITAGQAGLVGFVAPNVINDGIITAKLGMVQLASGDTATVDFYGDGLMEVAVSDQVKSQIVSNAGLIEADGGKVALTAAAGAKIVNSLINMQGALQAQSVGEKDGEIIIAAMGSNAVDGNIAADKGLKQGSSNVKISGALDASGRNPGERGGKITVTGDNIALLNGAARAGRRTGWPYLRTETAAPAATSKSAANYLGQGTTPTALNLYVDPGALILNDALRSGDAGLTIFWSDNETDFYGNVYARALGGLAWTPPHGTPSRAARRATAASSKRRATANSTPAATLT